MGKITEDLEKELAALLADLTKITAETDNTDSNGFWQTMLPQFTAAVDSCKPKKEVDHE